MASVGEKWNAAMSKTRSRALLLILGIFGTLCVLAVSTGATLARELQTPEPAQQGRGQPAAPPPAQAGHPSGKLVIWGDVALFERPGTPNNCILTNRFRRGQRVGFRMTAIDGGSGEVEQTAVLIAHVTAGGRSFDLPMRWRGTAGTGTTPRGYLRPPTELWTGFWVVPDDAPIGAVTYTVTARDMFGRAATFTPFPYDASQLTIVE
jgi:hypothetical protein